MYIILGAGSGLGRKIAKKFYEKANTLILAGRSIEHLKETEEIFSGFDQNTKVYVETVDLTQDDSINNFINRLEKYPDKVRCLVNTAAGFYKGLLHEQSMSSIDLLLKTNYAGVVRLMCDLIKSLDHKIPLDIINVTSISSATNLDTSRSSSIHIGTKAALHTMGKVLGRELISEGIRISSVAPGTYSRKGRKGIQEDVIVDIVEFLIDLPKEAWIESIDVRPTLIEED